MPRATVSPAIIAHRFFEDAPIAEAKIALDFAKETIRRRLAGETIHTANGPRIEPPQADAKKPRRKRTTKPAPTAEAATQEA